MNFRPTNCCWTNESADHVTTLGWEGVLLAHVAGLHLARAARILRYSWSPLKEQVLIFKVIGNWVV